MGGYGYNQDASNKRSNSVTKMFITKEETENINILTKPAVKGDI